MASPEISVIVTTCNEGAELRRTLESVIANTRCLREIIVVDDGSDDGSTDDLSSDRLTVIRHQQRIGVAHSRHEGALAARGNVLCYLDAHHRLSQGCLDHCAQVALERRAIASPDIRDYGWIAPRSQGAEFELCSERGYFTARWRTWRPLRRIAKVGSLRAPPYAVPREIYPAVSWSTALRGWGASEASLALKAFFSGIDILHVPGVVARHQFRSEFSYPTTWPAIWRNHAIIARVCFDDITWFQYWLPHVFEQHLDECAQETLESADVQAEHREFLRRKVRTDQQFWTDLVRRPVPSSL